MREIKIGAKYKHWKGNLYEVIAVARHSENPQEEFVVYKALYNSPEFAPNQVWVRPKSMFLEKITKEGKSFYRFEEIGKESKSE